MSDRQPLYDEIDGERIAQDAKYGGAEHDDEHSMNDFISYIVKHTGKAVEASPEAQRDQMLKVAALAVAAIEKLDRRSKV